MYTPGAFGGWMRAFAVALLTVAWFFAVPAGTDKQTIYTIDAKQSKILINVSREGFLKAFGHDHVISAQQFAGEVRLSQPDLAASTVSFSLPTKFLAVVDPGESEKDRQEVQATMLGDKVLDVARYPAIEFTSTSLDKVTQSGGAQVFQLEGVLRLHGAQKNVRVPIQLRLQENQLAADGEISLLQTDYGISPVKAGGGAVRVKDKLKISFHFIARPATAPAR
jgi:polyisoprenoid-binding protein YceI